MLEQINLTDIYRTFHPKSTEYTFFSSAHRTLSRVDIKLGNYTSLNKYKKTGIIYNIFSGNNIMKLEINYKKKTGKKHKCLETKQHDTKSHGYQWIQEEIKEEIKNIP